MRPLVMLTRSVFLLVGICIVALSAGWVSEAGAQVVLSDPNLPPEPDPPDCESLISLYAGTGLFASYSGPISMSTVRHRCFQSVIRTAVGADEHETFDSFWDATMDFGLGPVSVTLTGPVTTVTYGKIGNTTGTFEAEIAAMSLSGTAGSYNIQLRESPTLASPGQTAITDLGGGLYQIDSFFDVYTELSVDGGETWLAQTTQAARIILVPISTIATQSSSWGAIKSLHED
ncbi:MAG: hypothetical protein KOO63_14325 [Bacteroidales bacterium]|nr:hypothetical protein [Candidatus Latescibacterota bacterium]